MRKLLLCFIVLLLAACKVDRPKGILSDSKMEQILYEYHLLKSVGQSGDSTDIKTRAYELACLRKHGVTEKEFEESMIWYCTHMEELQKIYQRISERYNAELASLGAATNDVNRYSTLSATGDTANVWNGRSFYLLSTNGFSNRVAFEVKADTSHKVGDKYMLNFRAEFLQREGQRDGIAALAVQYENDSVASQVRHFYGSGDNSLTLSSVSLKVKRIYGYIYMHGEWNTNPRLLFIFRPSLVRMKDTRTIIKTDPSTLVKSDSLRTDSVSSSTDSTSHGVFSPSDVDENGMHSRPMPRRMRHRQ